MAEGERMRIVALGDSLTVGETGFYNSNKSISYPKHLQILAEEYLRHLGSGLKVVVLNRGVNGDLTSGMLERFSKDVVDERADYVIILGGANDIGWSFNPATIAQNLTMIYDASLKGDIVPVACSVPSILGFDAMIPPRLRLNRIIRTEAERRSIAFMDLFAATSDPHNNRLSEDYSADGLHLNSKGYEQMGKYIFGNWLKTLLDQRSR